MISAVVLLAALGLAAANDAAFLALTDGKGNQVWSDFGSVARYHVTIFEANLRNSQWKVFGHVAQRGWGNLQTKIHSFRALDETAVAMPTNFTQIWNCQGDTTWTKGSFWRVSCPDDYVALGDVLYPKNNVDVLPSGMYDKIRCVKKNLTEECLGIGDKIWDNVVSIARNRASLWSIRPQSTVFSEYFFAHTNADNKPNVTPYCLKRSSYIIL